MLHLRHLIRPLVVVVLLATGLALAIASPAGAQSSIRVFTFESADSDDWEVQITVQSLGGCDPPNARPGYVTSWLEDGDEDGEVLDPGVCNYRITALARESDSSGQLCEAEVRWSTGNSSDFGSSITTAGRPEGDTTVVAQHTGAGAPSCSAQPVLAITINPEAGEESVVQPLPPTATNSSLEARARRAVEITEFRVKVTPESTSINRTGCNQTLDFFVLGDGDEVEKALSSLGSGVTCEFRITVTEAPPPFIIRDANGEKFSTADKDSDGTIDLDLSEHVQLPWNRIVIIQDVNNNPTNQGSAAYKISSACAGVAALPPIAIGGSASGIYTRPGGGTVASLIDGRFTVHKPGFANFGAGAVYPAVATSTTSAEIGGCSVTVSIEDITDGCTLAGTSTRTLTWTSANPLQSFDFEFDIYCGGRQPPVPDVPPPAPSGGDSSGTTTDDTSEVATVGTDDVRIVARKLSNGKIEFGLQQQQDDDTWGDELLPRARRFPTDARVGAWLQSSPLPLTVAESTAAFAEEVVVRIVARKRSDGKVEFGLQERGADGSWGERQLPRARLFPTTARVDAWLRSSVVNLG